MGLLDFITGGENKKAEEALNQALAEIQGIQTPTAAQLQLSPLEQYYLTGNLTPAAAEAAQTGPSAFNAENLSAVPVNAMQQALAGEQAIANAQGMTPQEQAAVAEAESNINRDIAGQRGAIAADFAQKGIPASLISAALQNATLGQEEQAGYEAALQARSDAANRGLQALQASGQLGGQLYQQEAGQANTIAAAQNALNQFNAANRQQSAEANAARQQAAREYNVGTAQNLANQNITSSQQRQVQNQVEAPQQAAGLALQKGSELAGLGEARAGQATQAGQQQAGLVGGLIGAGALLAGRGPQTVMIPGGIPTGGTGQARGGEIQPHLPAVDFRSGGDVPGEAPVPGDDERNDMVPARLSPGEFVVPRSAMARPMVRNFLAHNVPTPNPPSAHPSDIASIMRALSILRGGAPA